MRVAIISDWFTEKMGYSENFLPKAMATLGVDIHVITSNAQVYFDTPFYRTTYEPFIGPPLVECGVKQLDGYTLHRLPFDRWCKRPWKNRLYIPSLFETLAKLQPDIVQTFDVSCPSTHQVAMVRRRLGYQLFLETHVHASVLSNLVLNPHRCAFWRRFSIRKWVLGRLDSRHSVKCYPISADAAEIAILLMGVPRDQIEICSLGVDNHLFHPAQSSEDQSTRTEFRRKLGFDKDAIVCIYTGRLTSDKGPQILAQAVDKLVRKGTPFRGLFVGAGTPDVVETINRCAGCVVSPFVPTRDLPPYYWSADIGVWPKQESTSQLDAMACGLPIVVSNRVEVKERVDGNGLYYEEGNANDLANKLTLLKDVVLRCSLGKIGTQKIANNFSWQLIAEKRLADYARSLGRSPVAAKTELPLCPIGMYESQHHSYHEKSV